MSFGETACPVSASLQWVLEALEEIFWPVFNQMNWKKNEKASVRFSGDKWKVPYFLGAEQSRTGRSCLQSEAGDDGLSSSRSEQDLEPGERQHVQDAAKPPRVRKPVCGHQ